MAVWYTVSVCFITGFLYHLLNVLGVFQAALDMIVCRGTPALSAALAAAALVEPGAKTVVSMPAKLRVDFTHLLIVDKVAPSCGVVVVTNKFLDCLNFSVLFKYAFR